MYELGRGHEDHGGLEPDLEINACSPEDELIWDAVDDVKGGALDPERVRLARRLEMEYIQPRKVYRYSTVEEAFQVAGKKPISVGWVGTNKGDDERPNYRSRLVAKET